ncbi:MAG: adenylate/guanylate cyclase domain-containing protein, partial [Pseudomonadota bacterium]
RLWHQFDQYRFPSLGLAPVLAQLSPQKIARTESHVLFAGRDIPIDEHDRMLIKYYKNYPSYSYSGIVASLQAIRNGDFDKLLVNPEEFLDKIVYVGVSAAGLNDLKNSPMDANLPGVYIHATTAANILNRDFIALSPEWLKYVLIVLLASVTVFGVLYTPRIYLQIGIPGVAFGAYFGLAFLSQQLGYVVPVVAPGVSTFLALTSTLALLLLTEGREKRKIKRMMSQYLSPAVLETVVNNPEEFIRAEVGSNENLTILFSDIRGFTSMSEILSAERVVEILNFYFSEMTEIIFRHEGTIDKFIGDAIMSFWGAPIRTTDHADRAVHAASQMITRLQKVNDWLKVRGYPALKMGIGLNTGNVVLGNIGSEHKLEYTVIGDNVNLASRMEGLTKQYGCSLLISESTYNALTTATPCRLIDLVRVKGKKQPIRIYQPLLDERADEGAISGASELVKKNEAFFSNYLARRWQDALAVLGSSPDDTFKRMMTERCRYFQKSPPHEQWDGVYTATSK